MATFITKKQAAIDLKCDERTIYKYLSNGILRPWREGNRVGTYQEDVDAFKKAREARREELPFAVNKFTFNRLAASVRRLEVEVAAIMRVLGMRQASLDLTDAEAQSLYKMVETFSLTGWTPHNEEHLSDTFLRMRFEDLEQIWRINHEDHPWLPFHRLVSTMYLHPFNTHLRDQFSAGKINIEKIANLWIESRGGNAENFRRIAKKKGKPVRKVETKLKNQQKPPRGSPHSETP